MVAESIFFDFSARCPQPSCGEPVDAAARFCPYCGASILACPTCRATNRLLALHCRACGQQMPTEVWPMQAGLAASRISWPTIHALEQSRPPYHHHLGATVDAPAIAADGLIIVPLGDGTIALINEFLGKAIGRLPVAGPIAVAPALHRGFLFVPGGNQVFAFDLPHYLDQKSKFEPRPVWSFAVAGSAITQPLLIDDGAIYVVSRDGNQAALEALWLETGKRVWTKALRFNSSRVTPPLLVRERLVLLTQAGEASLIDPASGRVLHTLALGRELDLRVLPRVVSNRVLLADTNNNVLELLVTASDLLVTMLYNHRARIASLAASDEYLAIGHLAGVTLLDARGHVVWSNETMESVTVAPIIAGESLLVLDDSGMGLLFGATRASPVARVKLLPGEINTPPLLTHAKVVATNASGLLATIGWS